MKKTVTGGKNMGFEKIKGKLGFGCMRLPMLNENDVDIEQMKIMVDTFMANGFNYFDTAHVYIHGESEKALKETLTSRYPRESYVLADKLSPNAVTSEEAVKPQIYKQLEICGVDYFDVLLMHCQNDDYFEKYKACRAYEQAFELKAEGKVKHVGFSFHDSAEVLDKILTAYPQMEIVQLQFNYVDFEDEKVQSRLCYEVCRKHGKPVIVMEPVKGGTLANVPPKAEELFKALGNASPASYAVRFAAGFPNVMTVLSGMSTTEQMNDNVSYMRDFKPLDEKELEAVNKARVIIENNNPVRCTGCRYCVDGCPMNIVIPEIFAAYNIKRRFRPDGADEKYAEAINGKGKPTDCIKCGMCESSCPQNLEIRSILEKAAKAFEK